ncbi:MAG: TetR/AcrR family transcriptional regulator [Deltaproteobacteria bacterium]|nr:TetR/AcrR family transcriptional regulator [Deltaproteobacteria bacterium]
MGEAKRERERPPLSQERVLQAALALCDAEGIAKLSMRRIAQRLGVEAMSLYHHVANKDAILDGLVDAVFAEIALPPRGGGDWRAALALRCHSARAVLLRHGWAVGLLDSRRNPGPATIRHHDAVIGCLRDGGFSLVATTHAFSMIDSYLYGFVLQELALPIRTPEDLGEVASDILAALPVDVFPAFSELARHTLSHGWDADREFEVGLSAVLGAIASLAT